MYLKSLTFNAFQIGVLMSLLQVMRIFAPNIWGHIADRTGKRTAIVQLAAACSVLVFAGVFFGSSFWWLFAVMAALSFFWSASLPLVEAMTLSHLGEHTDGYGRIRLWGSIGFILMVVGLGYVFDVVSIAWLPWAVLAVMLGIVAFARVIPEADILPHHTDQVSGWDILRQPEVASLLIACLLMAAAHGPYYTFYSIYLVDHGYGKSTVGWLWALGVLCEIGIFLIIPRIFARVSPRRLILASFALAVVRFLLIAWGVESAWLIWGAQTLHAFSFGTYHAAAVALIHQHFRGRHQARGQALYTSIAYGVGGTHRRFGQRRDLGKFGPGMDVYPGRRERGIGVGRLRNLGRGEIHAGSVRTARLNAGRREAVACHTRHQRRGCRCAGKAAESGEL